MDSVVIRRFGSLIDLSADGRNPIDPRIIGFLHPLLSYEHKKLLRGHQRYSPDGQVANMEVELRHLYGVEEGRLVAGFGFLTTIVEALMAHGITPRYVDISPAKEEGVYEPDWDNVRQHITFRDKQEECLQYVSQNQCGLINATMGFGKTFLFEAICHLYPKAKVDIVVKPKDVAKRLVRQLSRSLPNVGMVGGGERFHGDRVTIYTAGSMHHTTGEADFLLCDEAHMLMTDTFSQALATGWRYSRNFGFTGTPAGRMDGAHAQLELFFGRQIFYLSYEAAAALGLVVPIHVRWLPINLVHNPAKGKSGVYKMKAGIWRNQDRNSIFANDIRNNYQDPDTQILVLVATVDHAIMLWQFLPEFSLCYGSMLPEKMEWYKQNHFLPDNFAPTTPAVRDEMREQFSEGTLKRVIATDVWATGVDFEQLQVLYRLDARESPILDAQGPARVSRISPTTGKKSGEVIDGYDCFDEGFKRKSASRRRNYAELKWSQDWPETRGRIRNA